MHREIPDEKLLHTFIHINTLTIVLAHARSFSLSPGLKELFTT